MKKVITYGTFDLFHEGHYKLLERAKALGDYLIVGVTTEHFDEARGKVNVMDSLVDRIDNVRKTGFADEIIVEDHDGQKVEDIQKYGVDIFVLGSDWCGQFDYLKEYCQVVYLERTAHISSTMIRKEKFPIVRIGIIGTGRMAPRFISEAKYVSGIEVESAYNPEKDSAASFEEREEVRTYTHDFEEFIQGIDAVYVASPNETHYQYAKQALEHGKHVLSEKPLGFSYGQTLGLYQLAREKNVILMEGIKTAYCPGFQQLISVAQSGKIGKICDVEACFSRLATVGSRERTDAKYGGAFLEFAGYTLLPIFKLFGTEYQEVQIDSILGESGIDLYTKIQLRYPQGMATAKMGVGVKSEGELVIAGTEGYILAPSPWWLTKHFEIRRENPNDIEHFEPMFQGDGLRYEISEFVGKINGKNHKNYKLTEEESIAMSKIVEKFMEKRNKEQG